MGGSLMQLYLWRHEFSKSWNITVFQMSYQKTSGGCGEMVAEAAESLAGWGRAQLHLRRHPRQKFLTTYRQWDMITPPFSHYNDVWSEYCVCGTTYNGVRPRQIYQRKISHKRRTYTYISRPCEWPGWRYWREGAPWRSPLRSSLFSLSSYLCRLTCRTIHCT